jgi:hypothetical protein
MAKWFESFLGKPYESELKNPAIILFMSVSGPSAIVVAWPFIGVPMANSLLRSGFDLWAFVPVESVLLIGLFIGAVLGRVVDRRSSERTRLLILRCRQVFFLMVSVVGLLYCLVYLNSNSVITTLVFLSLVFLAFGQTRWRPRPGALRRSSRDAS